MHVCCGMCSGSVLLPVMPPAGLPVLSWEGRQLLLQRLIMLLLLRPVLLLILLRLRLVHPLLASILCC